MAFVPQWDIKVVLDYLQEHKFAIWKVCNLKTVTQVCNLKSLQLKNHHLGRFDSQDSVSYRLVHCPQSVEDPRLRKNTRLLTTEWWWISVLGHVCCFRCQEQSPTKSARRLLPNCWSYTSSGQYTSKEDTFKSPGRVPPASSSFHCSSWIRRELYPSWDSMSVEADTRSTQGGLSLSPWDLNCQGENLVALG